MKEKTKYLLIGIIIGIAIGVAVLYLMMISGILRPHFTGSFGNFTRPDNATNFSRAFRPGMG